MAETDPGPILRVLHAHRPLTFDERGKATTWACQCPTYPCLARKLAELAMLQAADVRRLQGCIEELMRAHSSLYRQKFGRDVDDSVVYQGAAQLLRETHPGADTWEYAKREYKRAQELERRNRDLWGEVERLKR